MGKWLAFTFALTGRREWGHGTQGVALGYGLSGLSARAGPQTGLFPHNLHLTKYFNFAPPYLAGGAVYKIGASHVRNMAGSIIFMFVWLKIKVWLLKACTEPHFSTNLLHINALPLNRRELASSCVQPPLPCACSLLCGKRLGAWWSCRQEERGANHC